MNAKNIDSCAFIGCEDLKEIHIRSGVENLNMTAFAMLTGIETICLEGIDPRCNGSRLGELYRTAQLLSWCQRILLDEQLQLVTQKFASAYIIVNKSQVQKDSCQLSDDPMPDIDGIVGEYGI
ncbi:MAG: hypothetical protein ACLTER_05705 [Ruminococcus sp.]